MANQSIQSRSTVRATAWLFTFLLAVLFLASLSGTLAAKENMPTLRGEVVAIDSYTGVLTLRANSAEDPYAEATERGFAFAINPKTPVTICYQNKSTEDIKVGETVSVTYHERDGKLFADAIDIAPVILACYDQ